MDINATMTAQPKTKRQIDILEIAEVALVEAARINELGAAIQGGGSARTENIGVSRRPFVGPLAVPFSPCPAGDVVTVPGPIEIFRCVSEQHPAREARGRWFAFSGSHKGGQPSRLRHRIGIE